MQHPGPDQNLVDLLRARAAQHPDRPVYTFFSDGAEQRLSYGELDLRARAVAGLLQREGAAGERVLLLYPPGLDYIVAFFGCLYAGAVAVPAYPPGPARLERTLPRLIAIAADARPLVSLTTTAIKTIAESLVDDVPEFQGMRWRATDSLDTGQAADWRAPALDSATLAFLQYTSGSTAAPKGVMISHGNLLHNSQVIQRGFVTSEESRGVFWLPFYHDMGLIGGLLQTLYCGGESLLLSPVDFLQRPRRWLEAISRFGATISGGPNFAYDLCVRKIGPEQRAGLDLSSWRLAFNGAEPIRAETIERFSAAFEPYGFRREAFYPCYGLAETTLMVSGVTLGDGPLVQPFDQAALERGLAQPAEADARRLVGSGRPLQPVVIADPATGAECGPGQVGEIWVAGPSVAQGYWGQPEQSARSFGARLAGDATAGPFLRTGDLGFLHAGELFVTGRIKDLIIIRGRNHYPQDIELTVERSHPALRAGCGAAFSIEVAGEERLVVVQELERQHRNADTEEVAGAIRQAVARQHELHVHAVALLRTGSIPKTSSGKIQRHACREGFLAGSLEIVGASQLDEGAPAAPAASLSHDELLAAEPSQRGELLAAYLQAQIAQALRVAPEQIGLDRPASALGLDSLMAVELQHAIESDLGLLVPMVSFLEDRSVAELAGDLLAQLDSAGPARLERSAQPTDVAPLSPGQRALWFLHQLAPESAAYTIASAVQIDGDLDADALRRSFARLVERHPALRTTFEMRGGEVVQIASAEPVFGFAQHDATSWSAAELDAWLREAALRPFDLARGPLLRLDLLARPAGRHVLLLCLHHSVGDLWSLAVLADELGRIYPAERAGVAADLPPAPLAYADYVRWQADLLAGPEGERLWAYWQRQLEGAATALQLPTDRPRPPVQTYNGAAHSFRLDAGLTGRLKALAEARGATLFAVLLAGFEALLYRYSGQHDFLVGTPTAGRSRAELAGTVGYFVNSLALRADLSGAPSFAELIERARRTSLAAFAHQELPFVSLAERLDRSRDLSRSPLFQVMFALQNVQSRAQTDLTAFALSASGATIELGGLRCEPLALEQRVAQFDLSLAMGEVGSALAASLEYNSDLFDAATAARMAGHLETLLRAAVEAPERRVDELPLLDAADLRQILVDWNASAAPTPAAGVHNLFEEQARRTPDAIALICGDEQLSYRELNERAAGLAGQLRALGVGAETPVGICADRSAAMLVGTLAILKAGGAYLPLDPTYPAERLAAMLRQAGAPVLLLGEGADERLRTLLADTLAVIEIGGAERADGPALMRGAPVAPGQAACIIYTSGSTGQPKGVLLTHGGITNLIESFLRSYEPGADDRIVPLTALASASFVGEIFPLLCAGGTLVLPSSLEVLDFEALFGLIVRHRVTMLSTVPAMIARLNSRAEALPALRLILSGGEALAPGDIDRLIRTTTISNGYGLTETTVCSTFYHVDPRQAGGGRYIPIGRPLINTQVYILDEHMQPAPIGVPGELYIGGAGLARGYLGDPAQTAERFVPDPFGPPGGRLYRTGDRARWLPDGLIEFVGRLDQQVKIRGFRIEPGEIEAALSAHPAVREAAVVAREDTPGERRLVAYVVADAGLPVAELRSFLRERLPAYMLPAAFVTLEALPLSPNGKLDPALLPPPTERPAGEGFLAPRGEVERSIAAAWQAALGVASVGIHDNFFDLGGHSLLLVEVHNQLKQQYGQLTLIDMFRHPTIAALAAHLSAAAPAEDGFAEFQSRAEKQRAFRDRRKGLAKGRS